MSEADERERPAIKVTDRRLFDADGNLREPDPSAAAADRAAPDVDASPKADSPAAEAPTEPTAEAADTAPETAQARPPLQFTNEALMRFIEEQYIGGMLALGAMPEPQSGQMVEDLDLAHVRIEMLGALQERTEGHRSPEATKALEDVLYQLRMVYLQKRKVVKL